MTAANSRAILEAITETRSDMTEMQREISKSLAHIDQRLTKIEVEMAETRGAYRLARFVIALLGLSGIGGILAWLSSLK